ncbi:MAG: hypothetical protein L0216_15220 [Planctomycetales bacterium]|nr:hypothetical protein [Planctomycetales bacterium]
MTRETRHGLFLAVAVAACAGIQGLPAAAQEKAEKAAPPGAPGAPDSIGGLDTLLPAGTQVAVLAGNPAKLLEALEEKFGEEEALAVFGEAAGEGEGGLPAGFGPKSPLELVASTARALLGTGGVRETVQRLTFPVAVGISNMKTRPMDFMGVALAEADLTFLADISEAEEKGAALAKGIAERLERGGEGRELEFRGETIRIFSEKVKVPVMPKFEMPGMPGGPGGGGGGGGGGGEDGAFEGGPFGEDIAFQEGDKPAEGETGLRTVTRAIVLAGTLLAVAPSEEAARQILLRRNGGGEGETLAGGGDYAPSFAPLGAGGDVRTWAALGKLLPEGQSPFGPMLDMMGLRALRSRASVLRLRAEGPTEDSLTLFTAGADRGMLAFLAPSSAGTLPQPGYIPGDASEALIVHVSWSAMWSAIKKMIPNFGPEIEEMMVAQLGFHPDRDVFQNFGDLLVGWEPAAAAGDGAGDEEGPPSMAGGMPRILVRSVKDEARLKAVLAKVATVPGSGVERKEFQGRDIYILQNPQFGAFFGLQAGPGTGLCVTGGHAITATSGEQAVRDVVGRLAAENSGFFGDEGWKDLRGHLPASLSGLRYARRVKDHLKLDDASGGGAEAMLGLGVSFRCFPDLMTSRCDLALEGLAVSDEGIRSTTVARWAPVGSKKKGD